MYLSCFLDFQSSLSLEELGKILSKKVFGGIPFGGVEEAVMDEVPALYLQRDLLGLYVVIHGYGGKDGYTLEMYPRTFDWGAPGSEDEVKRVDIAPYMKKIMMDVV